MSQTPPRLPLWLSSTWGQAPPEGAEGQGGGQLGAVLLQAGWPYPGDTGGTTQPCCHQPLTEAAVRPEEPSGAVAGPRGRITGAPVETPTQLFTAWPIPPGRASLFAARASEARGTAAGPSDVVAGSAGWAAAALGTGPSKPAPQAGALTLVPSPASRAEAAARVRVTQASVEATAAVRAASSDVPGEALLLTGQAGPALRAHTVA